MPGFLFSVRPSQDFQIPLGGDCHMGVDQGVFRVILVMGGELRLERGGWQGLAVAVFAADETVWIDAGMPDRRTERGLGDGTQQGCLAIAVVGQQQVDVGQARGRHPEFRKIPVRMAEIDPRLAERPEVLNLDVVDIHGWEKRAMAQAT